MPYNLRQSAIGIVNLHLDGKMYSSCFIKKTRKSVLSFKDIASLLIISSLVSSWESIERKWNNSTLNETKTFPILASVVPKTLRTEYFASIYSENAKNNILLAMIDNVLYREMNVLMRTENSIWIRKIHRRRAAERWDLFMVTIQMVNYFSLLFEFFFSTFRPLDDNKK